MILTRDHIRAEIKNGRARIDPAPRADSFGAASIDLRLGHTIRRFIHADTPLDIREDAKSDYLAEAETISSTDGALLAPGELILATTMETIAFPDDICALLEGRSRFARMGIAVHITAGFIQPGSSGVQVLEIKNMSARTLRLFPETPICQLILVYCAGRATHTGKYAHQTKPL